MLESVTRADPEKIIAAVDPARRVRRVWYYCWRGAEFKRVGRRDGWTGGWMDQMII